MNNQTTDRPTDRTTDRQTVVYPPTNQHEDTIICAPSHPVFERSTNDRAPYFRFQQKKMRKKTHCV